jgi:hypothetical protein
MITNVVAFKKEDEKLRTEQQQNDQGEGPKKEAKNNKEQEDRVEVHLVSDTATTLKKIFDVVRMAITTSAAEEDVSEKTDFDWLITYKILRFIFISGMVISVLAGHGFTDGEVRTNSPVGLVLQQLSDKNGNLQFDKNSGLPVREWVINVGGNSITNNPSFAISIPYYVIMLGLTGGYLRYLSKAASKIYYYRDGRDGSKLYSKIRTPVPDDSKPEKSSKDFAVGTEAEISEIVLAPLLAIVVWLLLSQGQTTTNIYWLAAVSFSIGLITKEIIDGIKRFMTTRLSFDTTDRSSSRG